MDLIDLLNPEDLNDTDSDDMEGYGIWADPPAPAPAPAPAAPAAPAPAAPAAPAPAAPAPAAAAPAAPAPAAAPAAFVRKRMNQGGSNAKETKKQPVSQAGVDKINKGGARKSKRRRRTRKSKRRRRTRKSKRRRKCI